MSKKVSSTKKKIEDIISNNKTRMYYLKSEPGNAYGLIVAFPDEEKKEMKIGFSLCHQNDHFDKNKARKIAIDRAQSSHYIHNRGKFTRLIEQLREEVEGDELRRFVRSIHERNQEYNMPIWTEQLFD